MKKNHIGANSIFRFSAAIFPNVHQKKDVNSIKPIKKRYCCCSNFYRIHYTNTLFDRFNNQEKLPISFCNSFCKRKWFKLDSSLFIKVRFNSKMYFGKNPLLFTYIEGKISDMTNFSLFFLHLGNVQVWRKLSHYYPSLYYVIHSKQLQ